MFKKCIMLPLITFLQDGKSIMNMLKTILATAIVASSASAMAAETVSPVAALKTAATQTAQQVAAPTVAKVAAVKTEAAVKTAEVKDVAAAQVEAVKAAPAQAQVKAEKKGWFSWFKKSA